MVLWAPRCQHPSAAPPEHQSLAVVRDVVADARAALYAQPRIGADSAGAPMPAGINGVGRGPIAT